MIIAKSLFWKGDGANLSADAFGIKMLYRIYGAPGNWTLKSPGPNDYVETSGYETQIAACTAAQIDFVRRIEASVLPAVSTT